MKCLACCLLYSSTYKVGVGVNLCRGCTLDLRQFDELMVDAELELERHCGQRMADEFALVVGRQERQDRWFEYSEFEREMIQKALNKPIKKRRQKRGSVQRGPPHWTDDWSKKWTLIRDVDTNYII